jgi:mannose-6-phosphate isomerase-like protein (cupin superfamily)
MRKLTASHTEPKGWLAGPWESELPIGIGFANDGIDAPHRHERATEVYLVAAGAAIAVVDGVEVPVVAGDVLIVEPHEVRSFRNATPDYRCFVVHAGGDGPDRVAVNVD